MRKILIVGSGQSGLHLALSLLIHGYDVTVMSARTSEEIRNGKVTSTQLMFHYALELERACQLNLWEEQTPQVQGVGVAVSTPPGTCAVEMCGPLDRYAQSVDQRIKMADWLELFENQGGKVVIHGATTSDLDGLTSLYDLVIVAAGRSELVELFDRDPDRSPYRTPQRSLAVVYVHGMAPIRKQTKPVLAFNPVAEFGELITIPALTLSGPCDILFWEGVPNGPLDCWNDQPAPDEHLSRTLKLMRQYVPWEYERCEDVELTDNRAAMVGAVTPVVRQPVGELPSGGLVLGMADVVVANDPITGQGSNNAAKCAAAYLTAILDHGDGPFDRTWMQRAFDGFWEEARHVTAWTNFMLRPFPEHVQQIIGAAATNPKVAARFANGFTNPTDWQHWLMDPDKTAEYLGSVTADQ